MSRLACFIYSTTGDMCHTQQNNQNSKNVAVLWISHVFWVLLVRMDYSEWMCADLVGFVLEGFHLLSVFFHRLNLYLLLLPATGSPHYRPLNELHSASLCEYCCCHWLFHRNNVAVSFSTTDAFPIAMLCHFLMPFYTWCYTSEEKGFWKWQQVKCSCFLFLVFL